MQLAIAEADVACGGEQLVQQGSPLLIGTGVVRPQQGEQIAFGLIGNHFDDVGQVLPFRGKQVWVGQISRDIGIRFTIHSPTLVTSELLT